MGLNKTNSDRCFITLEGADAAGKSSQLEDIKKFIELNTGREVVMTREPGGTELANKIRHLIKNDDMSPATETLLLNASRQEHLDVVIKPALNDGKIVLCDRFTDSTYAYQGGLKNFPVEKITSLKDWVQEGLEPDLTLYFDVELAISKNRRKLRGVANDRLETAMDKNFNSLRNVYLDIAQKEPKRFVVINGNSPIESVRLEVMSRLGDFLKDRGLILTELPESLHESGPKHSKYSR